ncbi:MAG: hypothetical protein MJ252_11580, partial [archaeon]|nr:hypothetical protein [archaeon]
MSNCQFTLTIKDISPIKKIKIPINNFVFQIKTESKETEIKLQDKDKTSFTISVPNLKDNFRFSIRLFNYIDNLPSLIGLADLLIPYAQIKQYKPEQNNLIERLLTLSMIDSTKRNLFGSVLKTQDIIVKIEVIVKISSGNKSNKVNGVKPKKESSSPVFKVPLSPKIIKNKKNNLKMELYGFLSPSLGGNKFKNEKTEKNDIIQTYTEGNYIRRVYNHTIEVDNYKKRMNKSSNALRHKSYKGTTAKTIAPKRSANTISTYSSSNRNRSMKDISPNIKNQKILLNNKSNDSKSSFVKKIKDNHPLSARDKTETGSNIKTKDDKLSPRSEGNEYQSSLEKNKLTNDIENIHSLSSNKNENPNTLKEKIKVQYKNILNFEKINQKKISELIQKNEELNSQLKEANEDYRTVLKKSNKVKVEKLKSESKGISVKTQQNFNEQFLNKIQEVKKNELKIFQKLFNKCYYDYDVHHYKEAEATLNLSPKDKYDLLFKYVKNIVSLNGS